MEQKTILITNDDGIDADGIIKLAQVAKKFGEVWVVAPDGQRSAMSHKITYGGEIVVKKYDFPVDGVKAFSCSGTPADCVRVGALKIMDRKPDFVFSGINYGFNIASDVQYSGTAAAAFEASFWGIQSIAFSRGVDYEDPSKNDFSVTDKYIEQILSDLMGKPLMKNQAWNVNFPFCKAEECKGVLHGRVLSQDDFYQDDYLEEVLEDGSRVLRVFPKRQWEPSSGTDLEAISNNFVSVGVINNIW